MQTCIYIYKDSYSLWFFTDLLFASMNDNVYSLKQICSLYDMTSTHLKESVPFPPFL